MTVAELSKNVFFILIFLLRELKNVIWVYECLWLGSGRGFKILDQRTYSKVIKRNNSFKATCFHRFDAGKFYYNVRNLTFLGSLLLQQEADQQQDLV